MPAYCAGMDSQHDTRRRETYQQLRPLLCPGNGLSADSGILPEALPHDPVQREKQDRRSVPLLPISSQSVFRCDGNACQCKRLCDAGKRPYIDLSDILGNHSFDDDAAFLRYLSAHCYDNEQQFRLARRIINSEIEQVKNRILSDVTIETVSPKRLNSLTIAQLLGYRYQLCDKKADERKLPKHFTESLPNDVNLGKIINGESITYEVLRKALMLLRFYNFYSAAENVDTESIRSNLMDFYEELNNTLISCGFSQIYVRHPFDCLLLYCANSYDPILSMHILNERN